MLTLDHVFCRLCMLIGLMFFYIVNKGCRRGRSLAGYQTLNPGQPETMRVLEIEMITKQIETNIMSKDRKTSIRKLVLPFAMPTTLVEAEKMWGLQNSLDMLLDTAVVRFQAKTRGLMDTEREKGRLNDADVGKEMAGYKPISNRQPADPKKRIEMVKNAVGKMSPVEKAALLKQLQG